LIRNILNEVSIKEYSKLSNILNAFIRNTHQIKKEDKKEEYVYKLNFDNYQDSN